MQDPHARVVDARDSAELVRLARTASTPSSAVAACSEIRFASATIVITIAAATRITTVPMIKPTPHSVDVANITM